MILLNTIVRIQFRLRFPLHPFLPLQGMTDTVSRLLPDRTKAGESQWCSIRCPQGQTQISKPDHCRTLYQIFQRGLSISMDNPCLGHRPTTDGPYEWLTYREVSKNADKISAGLIKRGMKKGDFIGISSHNCPEWTTTAFACDSQVHGNTLSTQQMFASCLHFRNTET